MDFSVAHVQRYQPLIHISSPYVKYILESEIMRFGGNKVHTMDEKARKSVGSIIPNISHKISSDIYSSNSREKADVRFRLTADNTFICYFLS